MKKLTSLVILLICAATVSAQLKQRIAVLPAVGDLEPKMLILLTDKVREIATQNLPIEEFNILKQDAIVKLIGEEELYRACKEGVCIGDLAKRTGANYGARCDIVKLDKTLVLKFEIYSVNEDAIFEMFTDYTVKDFYGMLKVLETRLPKTFQKLLTVSKSGAANSALSQINLVAVAEPAPKADSQPLPPQAGTITAVKTPVANVPTPTVTTFVDKRDGKSYKKVTIGKQTWMAENLNYDVPNNKSDVCYENNFANCNRYGRLYNWSTALKACPVGWHLPSDAEWTMLTDYVGGSSTAGTKLKSKSGWYQNNGTDDFGFSALPGGYGYSDNSGGFYNVGIYGFWWSATEDDANHAWARRMSYSGERVGRYYDVKARLFSVRCLQD